MTSIADVYDVDHQSQKAEAILFFISGLGSTIAWTAVLSNLVFYTKHLGAASYLYLNLAVYTPLLPISLIQARWDSFFDRKYDSLNTFLVRGSISYAMSVTAILLTPRGSNNLALLTFLTLLLGTSSAILQGALKQMAAFVYKDSNLLQAAVSSGMQGSSIFVLVVALSTGFGDSGDPEGLLAFNYTILGTKIFCWLTFYLLLTRSTDVMASMRRRDLSMRQIENSSMEVPMISDEASVYPLTSRSDAAELHYKMLWKKTFVYCLSLIITLVSSMLIAAYLNRVPSSKSDNVDFAQVLFYAKMIPDVLGRPFTILMQPKSQRFVLTITILRLLYVPIFLIYTLTDYIPRSDFWITLSLAVFSFFSGYIVTAAYQLAPKVLTEEESVNTSKQANLLNICFSTSLLLGLLIGLFLLICVGQLN